MIILAQMAAPKNFLERFPEVLREVFGRPLGFSLSLVMIVAIATAVWLWRKKVNAVQAQSFMLGAGAADVVLGRKPSRAPMIALFVAGACAVILIVLLMLTDRNVAERDKPSDNFSQNPTSSVVNPEPTKPCAIEGHVYNADTEPAVGMQNVQLLYYSASISDAKTIPIARTDPAGHFKFSCDNISRSEFPIRIQLKWTTKTKVEAVCDSEDSLIFDSNDNFNLYISPAQVAEHFKKNTNVMRLTSAQLFRGNFLTATNAFSTPKTPNKILAIPPSLRSKVRVSP